MFRVARFRKEMMRRRNGPHDRVPVGLVGENNAHRPRPLLLNLETQLYDCTSIITDGGKKIKPMPVLLFGREYWEKLINFPMMVEEGVIAPKDIDIFQYVDTADEAWDILKPVIQAVQFQGD